MFPERDWKGGGRERATAAPSSLWRSLRWLRRFSLAPAHAPAKAGPVGLSPILWELLRNLALRGFSISHTDHLSDAQL